MDVVPIFLEKLTETLANFTGEEVVKFFRTVAENDPSILKKMESAKTSEDIECIFSNAVGVIDVHADTGSLDINGGLLEAIRAVKFDHAHGKIYISNSVINAPFLKTGSSTGGGGQTEISENTTLKSAGTKIEVGRDCSIKITGSSTITQR